MTESSDSEAVIVVAESEGKKKKGKKPPSDFEVVRTILTRTHERKLPYLLRNMGEDPDILMLCSCDEDEFTYGSPELAVAIIEITDPELAIKIDTVLQQLYGIKDTPLFQGFVNLRDQISELAKTKGEKMDVVVEQNDFGSAWTVKTDIRGQEKTQYYAKAIDNLYHVQSVKDYCHSYRPLLTSNNPEHYHYPYSIPKGPTATILTIPLAAESNHPLVAFYPHGFRTMITRGLDVLIDSCLEETPYKSIDEELIVFQDKSIACQIAHRIVAHGWRMVLVRPNAVFFPMPNVHIPQTGFHSL